MNLPTLAAILALVATPAFASSGDGMSNDGPNVHSGVSSWDSRMDHYFGPADPAQLPAWERKQARERARWDSIIFGPERREQARRDAMGRAYMLGIRGVSPGGFTGATSGNFGTGGSAQDVR
jgi:hypothetical protein